MNAEQDIPAKMENDYQEKFDEIAKSVQEIKTANKFALKRLNQLLKNDGDGCPLCGCECSTDGYSKGLHELGLKVEDLEMKRIERESGMFRFCEEFRGFQKRLQCMISELPETLQEVLGSLFNMMEPFLSQTDGGQKSVDMNESTTTEKYLLSPESFINLVSLNSESSDCEKEGNAVNVLEEEVMDTVSETSQEQDKGFTLETEKFDIDKQEQLNSVVNKDKEDKQTAKPSQTGTEYDTNNDTLKPKEISTQALKHMVQGSECLDTVATEKSCDQQSTLKSAATTTTEEQLSRTGLDHAEHTDLPKSPPSSKLPEVVIQTERKEVEDGTWQILASEELKKAKALGLQDVTGAHTVLCFDISASMAENDAWTQAKAFFTAFISGLEDMKIEYEGVVEESIAFCTFGHQTGVVQRLTNKFSDIRTAFKGIKLGGPSPMYGGLVLSVAALAIPEGRRCTVHDVPVRPRIILVTDGHCTPTNITAGPDDLTESSQQKQAKAAILLEVSKKLKAEGIKFICVPVGHADKEFLGLLVDAVGNGRVIGYKDGRKQAKVTLKRLKPSDSGSDESILKAALGDLLSGGLFSDKLAEKLIGEAARRTSEQNAYEETDKEILPKIGSRVRRGPDWRWRDQDSYGPGTVIGHDDTTLSVYVEWDNNDRVNVYRYGQDGAFDLLLVDEPRALSKFEPIAVGCTVKKGPGWKSKEGDEGAAERGVVIKKKADNTVTVRWDDKKRGTYKWDGSRRGEVVVCDPREKAFQGSGHVLGGGPVFEAIQREKEQSNAEGSQQRRDKNIKKKNKNKI